MPEQPPITIRTLGDLRANGMGLSAYCAACHHHRALNLDDLIGKLGEDFVYVGSDLNRRLRCTECDEKARGWCAVSHQISAK